MRITTLRVLLAILSVAALVTACAFADVANGNTDRTTAATVAQDNTCPKVRDHNLHMRKIMTFSHVGGDFRASHPSDKQVAKLGAARGCVKKIDKKKYKLMRGAWKKHSEKWSLHKYIDSITQFGRWAIPGNIVDCESSHEGYWPADNPSGAIGPYQLLGKNAPWPAIHWRARAQHHIIAFRLWAGGRGITHWYASRHCWG